MLLKLQSYLLPIKYGVLLYALSGLLLVPAQGAQLSCEFQFQRSPLESKNQLIPAIKPLGNPKNSTIRKLTKKAFQKLLNVTESEFQSTGLSNYQSWRALSKGFTSQSPELVTSIQTQLESYITGLRSMSIEQLTREFRVNQAEAEKLHQVLLLFEIDQASLIQFIEAYGRELRRKNRVVEFDKGVNQMALDGIAHLDGQAIGSMAFVALGVFVILPALSGNFQELPPETQEFRKWAMFGVLSIGASIPLAVWGFAKIARLAVHTPFVKVKEAYQRRLARKKVQNHIKETLAYLQSLQRDLDHRTTTIEDIESNFQKIETMVATSDETSQSLLDEIYGLQTRISDYILDTLTQAPHPWLTTSGIVQRVLELSESGVHSSNLSQSERETLSRVLSFISEHKLMARKVQDLTEKILDIYNRINQKFRSEEMPTDIMQLELRRDIQLQVTTGIEHLQTVDIQLGDLQEVLTNKELKLAPLFTTPEIAN